MLSFPAHKSQIILRCQIRQPHKAVLEGRALRQVIPYRDPRYFFPDPRFQLFLLLRHRFRPYEGISVCVCFDLRAIHKQVLKADFSHLVQLFDQPIEQFLHHSGQSFVLKPRDRAVIRNRFSVQDPHEPDSLFSSTNLTARPSTGSPTSCRTCCKNRSQISLLHTKRWRNKLRTVSA